MIKKSQKQPWGIGKTSERKQYNMWWKVRQWIWTEDLRGYRIEEDSWVFSYTRGQESSIIYSNPVTLEYLLISCLCAMHNEFRQKSSNAHKKYKTHKHRWNKHIKWNNVLTFKSFQYPVVFILKKAIPQVLCPRTKV